MFRFFGTHNNFAARLVYTDLALRIRIGLKLPGLLRQQADRLATFELAQDLSLPRRLLAIVQRRSIHLLGLRHETTSSGPN